MACNWDDEIKYMSDCADKDELCQEFYFFSLDTDQCEQVICPDYTYVTESGKECARAICGTDAVLQIDGRTCKCPPDTNMAPSTNCVPYP